MRIENGMVFISGQTLGIGAPSAYAISFRDKDGTEICIDLDILERVVGVARFDYKHRGLDYDKRISELIAEKEGK